MSRAIDAIKLLAQLRERVEYDRTSGKMYRKPGFTGFPAGQLLGSPDSSGKLPKVVRHVGNRGTPRQQSSAGIGSEDTNASTAISTVRQR